VRVIVCDVHLVFSFSQSNLVITVRRLDTAAPRTPGVVFGATHHSSMWPVVISSSRTCLPGFTRLAHVQPNDWIFREGSFPPVHICEHP
jgi:hypothetical protein